MFFTTSFLYALSPQLKSCRLCIPENFRAVALNNLVGMVFDNGSYRFFFHPETSLRQAALVRKLDGQRTDAQLVEQTT